MNINHLHYFEEVCRQGSITKASEVCHISQPSITAAINGLENELGYKLFSRINNRLYLTDEGRAFKEITQQFLKEMASYSEKAHDLAKNRKTILKLGVPAVMGTYFFKKITLSAFFMNDGVFPTAVVGTMSPFSVIARPSTIATSILFRTP